MKRKHENNETISANTQSSIEENEEEQQMDVDVHTVNAHITQEPKERIEKIVVNKDEIISSARQRFLDRKLASST